MSRKWFTIGMIISTLVIAACSGGGNSVERVTPLPEPTERDSEPVDTQAPTQTPTVTPTEPPAEETESVGSSTVNTVQNVESAADATPTPQDNQLAPGEARRIAMETDVPMQPEIENPMTFDEFPVSLTFEEFYSGYDIRQGMVMTDKIQSLDGQQVVIEGYVAPPLKPRIDFFVLTRIQLAFCPFCSADTEWPTDIALVYMPTQDVVSTEQPVRVTGQLEIGTSVDADTGMVSRIRIYAEDIESLG